MSCLLWNHDGQRLYPDDLIFLVNFSFSVSKVVVGHLYALNK